MNAKRKGTRNEHRSIALLESAGYRCSRSAASLGEWDIVGIGPGRCGAGPGKNSGLAWPRGDGAVEGLSGAGELPQAGAPLAREAAHA
jgi:hypothetical protein